MEKKSPNTTIESMMVKVQEHLLSDSKNDDVVQEEMVQKFMQELYREMNNNTVACSPNPPPLVPQNDVIPPLPTQNEPLLQDKDQEMKMEHFGADFDEDEWIARVLAWAQVVDTSEWF
ncbi:hypothetical protein PIB30_003323 [Stylosanthes scabra]|uniref:Uncharacterized protein n=1 Tax=Stylosanthes scabra TaxID=79078 RepID=A0ABU6S3A0_9FABA|nr:hypothetical protein [Stylosanthes scabra]